MKFNKVCVLGLGYIGLPTASMFAANGVKVVGVDTNPNVVETLKAGRLHIHEPGLGEVLGGKPTERFVKLRPKLKILKL